MGFSWHSGIKREEVGEIIHYCRKCEEMRPFRVLVIFNHHRFLWLLKTNFKKRYMLYCDVCNAPRKPIDAEMNRRFGDNLSVKSYNLVAYLIALVVIVWIMFSVLASMLSGW